MKILDKIGLSVIIIFVLHAIFVLFVLYDRDFYFYEDSCFTVSLVDSVDDSNKSIRKFKDDVCENLNDIVSVKYHFFNIIDQLLNKISIQVKLSNIISIDIIRKKIFDIKDFLINKLMHQSSDLLNYYLITNTTAVLDLHEENNKVYWVIQLGAFKNFNTVCKIVDKLQAHNYLVYISPQLPKQGEIIRIFVGPDSSKKNLEHLLDDLYFLSGLSGKIILLPENIRK